jgi:hypothetical protein
MSAPTLNNTDRTDIEEFIVDESHIGFRVVYAGFARKLEQELFQRAVCGEDSSADSTKPQGSQVASPAIAHPIAPLREGAA